MSAKVAAGQGQLCHLNNVLIRVDENKVSLTTTNLDMAVVSFSGGCKNVVTVGEVDQRSL